MFADLDDDNEDGEVVRSYMLTRGRTRASVEEFAIETLVSAPATPKVDPRRLPPEERRILQVTQKPISIAEISALLEIPLRAAIVMVSEMVVAGTLQANATIEVIDAPFLRRVRAALQSL